MKILLFGGWGYGIIGGTEGYTKNLADSLIKKNQKVSVLVHKLNKERDREINNVKIYYVQRFPRIRYFLPFYFIRFFLIFLKAFKIRLKNKTEIVLTREPEALALIPLKLFGIKIIIRGCTFFKNISIEIDSHIKNKFISSFLKSLAKFYQKSIFKFVNGVIESSKNEIENVKKFTKKKIHYLPYAINKNIFYPSKNEKKRKILIYTGILRPIKRINLLIKLFDKIKEKDKNVKLYLIGPIKKPYTEEILRKKSKNNKNIKFFGEKNQEEIADILRKSYFFVQTASDLGNSPLEAAACGLPVLALGNFNEEFVINAKNQKDFVNKGLNLLNNKSNYSKYSKKNSRYVLKKRSWKMISENYINLFNGIINNVN